MKSHGNLKSCTCQVDSRWTVKVSFFGLQALTEVDKVHGAEDERNYSQLLWTAPELLHLGDKAPSGGTDKGDVYGFGIMLQEILFRNTPFYDSEEIAEGTMFVCHISDLKCSVDPFAESPQKM